MWRRRLCVTIVLITAGAMGVSPPEARAGVRHEPLFGDFNADGLPDSATLGSISPNLCSTIVEYGTATGVYLPPVAYTYLTPNGADTPNCPDIGVALNVDDDPADELYVGWTGGPPVTVDFSRLVLQPPVFAPSAFYTAEITRPTFIGAGRFSSGGRESPYGVGPGGVHSVVIEGSDVAHGPVDYCAVDPPTVQLTDLNGDGVDGMLISYTNGCEPDSTGSNGVVHVREDGAVHQLRVDPSGQTTWAARLVNADGDRWLDARTVDQATGEVSYFINDRAPVNLTLVPAPDANTDRVELTDTRAQTIDVLGNDYASRYAEVTVTSPPRYGSVQVLTDRRIVYRPRAGHGRTDRFSYQLLEEGKRSTATVSIRFPD